MKQELLDSIKKDYEDYNKMIETNFKETEEEFITPGRLKRVNGIRKKYRYWVTSEDVDINDNVLDEAINSNLESAELGETNKLLMYISELQYDTYKSLFGNGFSLPNVDEEDNYILYMDIEDNTKYFIKKEFQEEFEKRHNVIVMYKNPNCNAGWNFDRNMEILKEIRREFIRSAMSNEQEEVAKQFVKKYQENKD